MKFFLTLGLLLVGVTGTANAQQRFEYTRPLMGTTFRLVLYAPNSGEAAAAAEAAFDRIDALNGVFSDYREDSEASLLSAKSGSGEWLVTSDEMWSVLTSADLYSRATRGAFDVTVGVLSHPWREAMQRGTLPDAAVTRASLKRVGYGQIEMDQSTQSVRLNRAGMVLDFGGIAKGYAADEALRTLQGLGYASVLIDAGGDLVLGCPPPGRDGWNIAVPGDESGRGEMSVLSDLQSISVASSGATYQYIEADGVRYSHIIDPSTGTGVTEERSVSVAARSGMLADAMASAVSVLGIDGIDTALELGAVWVRVRERSGDEYIIEDRGALSPAGSANCLNSSARDD